MAPYAIGHLRLSYMLEEAGYKLKGDDRIKFYLTNALEMEELSQSDLPMMASLAQESHLANEVKTEKPILVILGNPPYFGRSSNFGDWISKEIRAYYEVDGHPLNEKNPKGLQDDYVKFIRLAQWKIDQAGEGVLGFITNHGYLDNVTFRGMRQSLMNSFDEIYILDLHGNSLKKEKCPDGSKDDNVFDIMPGVAISIFIKRKEISNKGNNSSKVYHSELWGTRESKYSWLLTHDISTTNWEELSPKSELYFFIPRNDSLLDKYNQHPTITDIFPISSAGIVTGRNELTIKLTSNEIWNTILNFSQIDIESARSKYNLGEDTEEWKIEFAQNDLKNSGMDSKNIIPIQCKPFDIRYTYYTGVSRGFHSRPRKEVMQHILKENISIGFMRQVSLEGNYNHVFISKDIIDNRAFLSSKGYIQQAPLYIYENKENETTQKQPNINQSVFKTLSEAYSEEPTPEEILYYIYSVLYSNTYREKYSEFLRIDFPRVPFTSDHDLFLQMADYGKRLVDLHLLESEELDQPVARFQGDGNGVVEKPKYDDANGRVYINKDEYFEGVSKDAYSGSAHGVSSRRLLSLGGAEAAGPSKRTTRSRLLRPLAFLARLGRLATARSSVGTAIWSQAFWRLSSARKAMKCRVWRARWESRSKFDRSENSPAASFFQALGSMSRSFLCLPSHTYYG